MANSSDARIVLPSYKDQNDLSKDHYGAGVTASDVETPAVYTIFACSIKACPPHATLLFSRIRQI